MFFVGIGATIKHFVYELSKVRKFEREFRLKKGQFGSSSNILSVYC